jgi:hypothetical protein
MAVFYFYLEINYSIEDPVAHQFPSDLAYHLASSTPVCVYEALKQGGAGFKLCVFHSPG